MDIVPLIVLDFEAFIVRSSLVVVTVIETVVLAGMLGILFFFSLFILCSNNVPPFLASTNTLNTCTDWIGFKNPKKKKVLFTKPSFYFKVL
eukprot:m.11900 g.11900  ORF g.11900 m.11900 type:complete len:91 (-) comp6685_c0_seq1:705-977(-)